VFCIGEELAFSDWWPVKTKIIASFFGKYRGRLILQMTTLAVSITVMKLWDSSAEASFSPALEERWHPEEYRSCDETEGHGLDDFGHFSFTYVLSSSVYSEIDANETSTKSTTDCTEYNSCWY